MGAAKAATLNTKSYKKNYYFSYPNYLIAYLLEWRIEW